MSIQAQKTLTVLHTNDTHSCVMPLNQNLADTLQAGRGGFIRRIAMLKEERRKDPNLLLFDSGDFSQGSPYYTLFKGDVEVGLMNEMGIDAGTLGNHEFDYGMDNLARLAKMARFPILCSNYDFTGTPLAGIIKPYTIIKRNGIRIGVFAIGPKLEGLVDRKNYQQIKYMDPVETTQKMTAMLKGRKKCDVVILLSHIGWDEKGMNDQQLIPQSSGIDLVLGGHSHSYFTSLRYVKDRDGKEVAVDQNGKSGIYIGKMTLTFGRKTGYSK
ncbi:bifunctional UDP-sugar hydrolase/5'-nucleotidase [uncultured Bifidobacterium sp.]|uniref:bifunctional metallophosphatase/5'-nucleotidase n=1 Tax=uncultured Bifidobacterium sp. TaxID=165187 RepID=UPI00258DE98C|nr:metallophosphatase [uncultured Bifidobacterium sp.]